MQRLGTIAAVAFVLFFVVIKPMFEAVDYELLGGRERRTAAEAALKNFDEKVLPSAASACAAAFAGQGQAAVLSAPIGTSVTLQNWSGSSGDYHLVTEDTLNEVGNIDAIRVIFCINQVKGLVHVYKSDNGMTFMQNRTDWDVRLISWPSGERLASKLFSGKEPPSSYMNSWNDTSYRTDFAAWRTSLSK